MSLVTTMLIYLMLQLVHYPITIYINHLTFVYYVCICNFNFFVKFIFTFTLLKKNSCCKLFSEINYYLLIVFSFKVKRFENHALFFICSRFFFSNICRRSLTLSTLHTVQLTIFDPLKIVQPD